MKWQELKWPDIQRLDKRTPVVVPLGSMEQHGPHLPLYVDSVQVQALAEAAEKRLGDEAIFLPVTWLGCSEHHRDFAGTVSASPELYSDIIKALVRSVLRTGFSRILLLNGHGGNEFPAAQALSALVAEDDAADAAHLCFANWWHLAGPEITADKMQMSSPSISHACEYETSMMLYLRPELVRLEAAKSQRRATPDIEGRWTTTGRVRTFHRWQRLTATGSLGASDAASVEKGERLFTTVTNQIVQFLQVMRSWSDSLPIIGPDLNS